MSVMILPASIKIISGFCCLDYDITEADCGTEGCDTSGLVTPPEAGFVGVGDVWDSEVPRATCVPPDVLGVGGDDV